MILHLATDDKFLDWFINNFTKYSSSEKNIYLVYNVNSLNEIKIIKSKDKVIAYKIYTTAFNDFISRNINNVTSIFLHSFSTTLDTFILSLPKSIKIYWLFWSGDFYSRIMLVAQEELFSREDLNYLLGWKFNFYFLLKYYYKVKFFTKKKKYNKAINRINYFLHWNELDFQLIKKYFNLDARFIPFFYGFSELYDIEKNKLHKNNHIKFLIGNSGSITNNILESLEILKSILKNSDNSYSIVCSLAYGNPKYIKEIIKRGISYFGNKFSSITTFMPLINYYEFINDVDIAIMNHRRLEGAGNVVLLLLNKKKIFLNKHSTLYKYLKKLGAIVYTTEDLITLPNEKLLLPLKINEAQINYIICNKLFSASKADVYLYKIAKMSHNVN